MYFQIIAMSARVMTVRVAIVRLIKNGDILIADRIGVH